MTSASLDSESRWALLWHPDWEAMQLRVSIDTDRTRGLTGREARRALASTLLFGLDYSVTVSAAVYAAQRENSDTSLGERPIQAPLWPFLANEALPISARTRWWLSGEESADGQLASESWGTTDPTPSAPEISIPTMRGYLAKPVEWAMVDRDWVRGEVQFDEAGPDSEAVTLPSQTWVNGPTVDGQTTHLFPLELFDYVSKWDPKRNGVDIEFNERIGFGRERSRHVYPQLAARTIEHSLTLQGQSALAKLLRWFQDHSGSVRPFWVPVWTGELTLASNTSSGSADVTLTNAALLGSLRRIAFVTAAGTVITRKVLSISSNTLTLDSSPGTLAADSTKVLTLALVRFASDQLTIDCRQMPVFATTTLAFEEVREEVAAPAGETAGTTIGSQTAVAYLYEFTVGAETFRYTSHESDIVVEYTPENAPGVLFWFNADDVSAATSSTWDSRLGAFRATNASAYARPFDTTYAAEKGAVFQNDESMIVSRLDGSAIYVAEPFPTDAWYAAVLSVNVNSGTSGHIFSTENGTADLHARLRLNGKTLTHWSIASSAGNGGAWNDVQVNSLTGSTADMLPLSQHLVFVWKMGASGTLRINGVAFDYNYLGSLKDHAPTGSAADSRVLIGERWNGTEGIHMNLRHLLHGAATLTLADIQRLEGFLAHDSGIESSLPSDHPYRYEAP